MRGGRKSPELKERWMEGQTDRWVEGWIDLWTDGWVGGGITSRCTASLSTCFISSRRFTHNLLSVGPRRAPKARFI